MKDKYKERLTEAARAITIAGEQIETMAFCVVGQVSLTREMGRAAVVGVLTTAATGGLLTAAVIKQPRKLYLAATRDAVLLFDGSTLSGAPGKHVATLDRRGLSLISHGFGRIGVRKGYEVTVTLANEERALRFTFPGPDIAEGQQFAASLAAGPEAPQRPRPSPR